jgi:hypothetical protein
MDTPAQPEAGPESIASGVSDPTTTKRKRLHRQAAIPKELRAEVTQYARTLARKYRHLFASDRQLKTRVLTLTRALLPPRPRRRGRPRNPTVTRAIALYRKFRRKSPEESPRQVWARVYPLAIPGYDGMPDMEQRAAREALRERITWRRRRKRRRPPEKSAGNSHLVIGPVSMA